MQLVTKRDGRQEPIDITKIILVLQRANRRSAEEERTDSETIKEVATEVIENLDDPIKSEDIQDVVESVLISKNLTNLAKNYIIGCYEKESLRQQKELDRSVLSVIDNKNEEVGMENSNKDPALLSTQRDYMAGEVSKDITRRLLLDKDIVEAHDAGIIHFHDMDYFAQKEHNCCLVNLEDMFENGTVVSKVKIDRPKSLRTAATLATQISAQVASMQYGGQTMSVAHLAPFVDVSRQKLRKQVKQELAEQGLEVTEEEINGIAESRLEKEIEDSVQTIQYQLSTLNSTQGQTPFITLWINLGEAKDEQEKKDLARLAEEIFKQRIQGVKNATGQWVAPAFPKLVYVLDEDNIYDESPYFWLTELAAKCTAKRMVPDYVSAKIMRELKQGDVYAPMGCRSFLTPSEDHKYYGRFNQGVVTINLPDVALSSGGDIEEFWKILDERLKLAKRALYARHNRLKGTVSDVAPILWQHGVLARLKPGEKIDKLLYNNYSTISLGYAGLYEMSYYITGMSHTDDAVVPFAKKVMTYLRDTCDRWRAEDPNGLAFSLYGTPMESGTYKFAKALRNRFGVIEEVTDHDYITNSYHVNVREQINGFDKISLEAMYQELSPGGAISYIECPEISQNIPAVIAVLRHIYDTILYAELNTRDADVCMECGYEGEIKGFVENGDVVWECPSCGNRDQNKMVVVRRTCGYIGSNFWNKGRSEEIFDRVLHL